MSHVVSISNALTSWLATKSALSASTRAAYAGEIQRLEEFCTSRRALSISDLSPELWHAYLMTLRDGRDEVRSKRQGVLKDGSARQAMRITRSFLTWLRDESMIGWKPLAPRLEDAPAPTPTSPARREETPRSTGRRGRGAHPAPTLTKAASSTDETSLRRELVGNLIFWAALRPAELAGMQASHMTRAGRGPVQCAIPGRAGACHVPGHVWTLWTRYRVFRERRLEKVLAEDAPLVGSLQGNSALSTWSVWALVRDSDDALAQSPRRLRTAFLRLLTSDAASSLSAARAACGLPRLAPVAVPIASRATQKAISDALSRTTARIQSVPADGEMVT